jgi:hypothetical protein
MSNEERLEETRRYLNHAADLAARFPKPREPPSSTGWFWGGAYTRRRKNRKNKKSNRKSRRA